MAHSLVRTTWGEPVRRRWDTRRRSVAQMMGRRAVVITLTPVVRGWPRSLATPSPGALPGTGIGLTG